MPTSSACVLPKKIRDGGGELHPAVRKTLPSIVFRKKTHLMSDARSAEQFGVNCIVSQ